MTEGPWDGSNLPPEDVKPHPYPPGGGGGGPVPPGEPADPEPAAHMEWPTTGVKPFLGGLTI